MKYALAKFKVHQIGSNPFGIITDNASLRTVTQSPHLSQGMVSWLSPLRNTSLEGEIKSGNTGRHGGCAYHADLFMGLLMWQHCRRPFRT